MRLFPVIDYEFRYNIIKVTVDPRLFGIFDKVSALARWRIA